MLKKLIVSVLFTTAVFSMVSANQSALFKKSKLRGELIEPIENEKYTLTVKYFPIEKNVFDSRSPSFVYDAEPEDIMHFTLNQPSYYFIMKKADKRIVSIKFKQEIINDTCKYSYLITNPTIRQMVEIPSELTNNITEHRLNELKGNEWGVSVSESDGSYLINEKNYKMLPFEAVKKELASLIELHKLDNLETELLDIEF